MFLVTPIVAKVQDLSYVHKSALPVLLINTDAVSGGLEVIFGIITGIVLLVCGVLIKKKPKLFMIIPVIILMLNYFIQFITDFKVLKRFGGLKLILLIFIIYTIIKIVKFKGTDK